VADVRTVLLAGAAALLLAGCGGGAAPGEAEKRVTIDWDVSGSHTPADVDWTRTGSDVDSREVRPNGPVRIRLPGGAVLDEQSGVRRVGLDREGDDVTSITVFSEPLSVDAAHERAAGWAKQFGLPTAPLDRWQAKARTEKPPDITAGQSIDNHRFLGPEGPVPSVELRTSFDRERPVVASVQFFWPGRRAPTGTGTGTTSDT
jgi:hypothetical protein